MPLQVRPKFISGDMTTDSELAVETQARVAGDSTLQNNINLEAGYRASADNILQSNIDAEASTRSAEDLTFLKHNGSRPMSGNLNLAGFNVLNTNLSQERINVTTPAYHTVTNNGVLNLSSASESVHFFTGTATGYSVVFPDATTLNLGTNFEIYNRSSAPITLKHFDGTTIGVLSTESVSSLILQDNTTQKGIYSPFSVEVAQAAGINNYNAASNTPFATTLVDTYQQITNFVVTPAAGKYAIWFNCSSISTTNNSINYIAIYKNGVILQDSERLAQSVSSNFKFQLNTLVVADFNGSEEMQVWIKVSAGILTINARTGVAIRLGPVG